MNLMTLQRYKNELILLLALFFMLGAFFYKLSAHTYVSENKSFIQKQISEIMRIEKYKKQWASKGMANKVKVFKNIVPPSKVKLYKKKSSKIKLAYINLTAKELNKISNKLLNTPIQIVSLNIKENSNNKFTMECSCKW